ncbi:MAG: Replicative DNA helicase DnaC [Candidatus Levybacteria bacterium GW2011_GWB1_36_18]|nr:MAG: Replicative DNA helicase DnaC [Candidatus Levybacteria bacterium GW2011_GWB1_36_18]
MAATKIPPHNTEAEQSVLGSILMSKEAIGIVSQMLKPGDFYDETHSTIFDSMIILYEKNQPIDLLTLATELKKKKNGPKTSESYLAELVNSVPTAANVEHYGKLIKEASIKRSLIESLAESFERIDELHTKGAGLRGVKTGFTDLDNLLSGMQASNLLILAARPGQGKTAMIVNIAQYVAVNEKKPVGVFSLEMSQEEMVDRLLVGQADVDAWRLKTGKLSETDFAKLSEAMGILADAPIFIDDTPGISVSQIRTKARRLQLEKNIELLIVDYLQLVDPGKRYDNRVQEVSLVSQSLKNLARELKIPVLAVSQLSRAVEHRGERKPQLADLRESGAIEQDADVVMFIYRPDSEIANVMPSKVLVAKHRNGPMGEIDLLFRGDRIRFYNVEKTRSEK